MTFDLKLGTAIHLGYLGPLSQIFCLVWSGQNELFFGSTGGIVASLIFVKEGNEASTPHIPREIATDPCLQYRATIGEVIPAAMSGCVTSLAFFQHTRPRLAIGVGRHVEIWESSGQCVDLSCLLGGSHVSYRSGRMETCGEMRTSPNSRPHRLYRLSSKWRPPRCVFYGRHSVRIGVVETVSLPTDYSTAGFGKWTQVHHMSPALTSTPCRPPPNNLIEHY